MVKRILQALHRRGQKLRVVLLSRYYTALFLHCGRSLRVYGRVKILSPDKIVVGNCVTLNENVFLNAGGGITIEDRVRISPGAIVNSRGLKMNHHGKSRIHFSNKVIIQQGAWIGSGAIINPGVSIGKNSIIGAGAVVTKDIPDNMVAVGIPARCIKTLDD